MIEDLSPLVEIKSLVCINGDNSGVNNVKALQELTGLKGISFVGTNISDIEALKTLPSLDYINLDNTEVPDWDVQELARVLPQTNVIFRTEELLPWWENLDQDWKDVFTKFYDLDRNPDTWALHKATASPKLDISGAGILNLEPLTIFFNLKELYIQNVPLQDPSAIARLEMLEQLQVTETPFRDLSVVSSLANLKMLDVSNTAVSELEPLSNLDRLQHLNLSGTNISNLKGLDMLYDLRTLDIASTGVKNLKQITHLINLEKLVCFNTRLNSRNVEKFQSELPNCEVRFY
jgi:Leucine-rich repeat (LRR) protein